MRVVDHTTDMRSVYAQTRVLLVPSVYESYGRVALEAAASGIPLTTLRDNIRRLVDRGLARRVPNPDDARSYLLELTPAGLAMTRAADPALLEAYLALEARLPRPLAEYERMLDELTDALEGALD